MVRPTSVAETINSNYLISDFDLHCIHVFQPTGSYMSRFGQRNLAGPYVSFPFARPSLKALFLKKRHQNFPQGGRWSIRGRAAIKESLKEVSFRTVVSKTPSGVIKLHGLGTM